MKLHTNKLTLGLMASLCAASFATSAEYGAKMGQGNPEMDGNNMDMMSADMKMDPVARAQKHLGELNARLNLTNDQQPAWQTFSNQVNDQAKKMASVRDQMQGGAQSMPKTAPEQMARMAAMMEGRAQSLDKLSDAVKTFYGSLTPGQQTTFDKIHTSHMARM